MSLSDSHPERARTLFHSAFAVGVSLFFAGCASQSYTPETAPEYVVMRAYTPFFKMGPMQPGGPDGSLPIDTRVKLLNREMGYDQVLLEDKRVGYVPDENLSPAPPTPSVAVMGEQASAERSGKHGRPNSPRYTGSQNNDTPLPDPNVPPPDLNVAPEDVPANGPAPAPTEKPKFRY